MASQLKLSYFPIYYLVMQTNYSNLEFKYNTLKVESEKSEDKLKTANKNLMEKLQNCQTENIDLKRFKDDYMKSIGE